MANQEENQGQSSGSGKLKPLLIFGALFAISFVVVFSILWFITRGTQSPLAFKEPPSIDSTAIADSLAALDSLRADSLAGMGNDSLYFAVGLDSVRRLLSEMKHEKKSQFDELDQIKKELANLKQEKVKTQQENEAQIKELAKVYEAMKPEDAAKIFKELDNEMVCAIIKQINQKKIAKILAVLPPNRAAELSRLLGKK